MKNSRTQELFNHDLSYNCIVAGCDEAGRGPLAGPVVCAACIMPLDEMIEGIDDSKKLSEKKRESLYKNILNKAISVKVSVIDNNRIDQINILNATKEGMTTAINGLSSPALVLIDALDINTNYNSKSIIKGDATSYNIAAASIIAKVTRDRIMQEMDELFPGYNLKQNKGYGTSEHIQALKQSGASTIHRKCFIKNILKETENE